MAAFRAPMTPRLWFRAFRASDQPQGSRTALTTLLEGLSARKKAKTVKKPKQITYWAFCIDIVGPRSSSKSEDRRVHKLLSRNRLREMEDLARRAVQEKLPHGFKAKIS